MTPKIHKILYATDLSQNSAYVFRYALDSAKKHNAKIIILHVLEKMPVTAMALVETFITERELDTLFQEKITSTMNRIQENLKIFCDTELEDDPQCKNRVESIKVRGGFPADMILRMADELNCDAIIMGTHARGAIANTFLGSTAKRVLRRTRKPVFIIPLPKEEIDLSFQNI